MVRSVISVFFGYVVIVVLMIVTTFILGVILRNTFDMVSTQELDRTFLDLVYGFVYTVVGGYATATMANRSETKHALALGIVLAAVSIVMLIVCSISESAYFETQPLWYRITLPVMTIPAALLGGKLRVSSIG